MFFFITEDHDGVGILPLRNVTEYEPLPRNETRVLDGSLEEFLTLLLAKFKF